MIAYYAYEPAPHMVTLYDENDHYIGLIPCDAMSFADTDALILHHDDHIVALLRGLHPRPMEPYGIPMEGT